MNTPRLKHLTPLTHAATLAAGLVIGAFVVTTPAAVIDRPAAESVCDGPLIDSGPEIASTHVVVNVGGEVKRLPTPYARSLDQDAIWVLGVCRKDVQW